MKILKMDFTKLYRLHIHITFTIAGVLFCLNLSGTNYYVKTTGADNKDGLTWANSMTLNAALSAATSEDVIHIAAGTYIPTTNITGGLLVGDMSFELKNNISLVGGYPANPVAGSLSGNIEKTILSGNLIAYHVVSITAPVETNKKVILNNLTITLGKAAASGTGTLSINSLNYPRTNGGAVIIGKSTVELNSCRIINNQSEYHVPGVYVFSNANVVFNNCSIENNIGNGNGGGLWNDGSTVSLNNCTISSNQTVGVGAGIYAFNASTSSKTNIYNSTISNNKASHKAGYYGREKSVGVIVNCTVFGNTTTSVSSGGGGVSLYTNNKSTNAAKLNIISSTITGNSGDSSDGGGGIRLNDQYCKLYITNSIVSGNANGDISLFNNASYSKKSSIISDKVYNINGNEILNQTFDYRNKLISLADNGGSTKTCALTIANNPAMSFGMSATELIALGTNLSSAVPITATGEKLVNGTDLFESISSDTTYTVTDGLVATEIKYTSTSGLAMKLFIFEVDLTNPNISVEASTPNNEPAFTRQRMTEQAIFEDQTGHKVYGGVNGDFFDLTTGQPRSIIYKNATAIKTVFQDVNRTYLAITKDKKACVGDQTTFSAIKNNIHEAVGGCYWLVRDSMLVNQTNTLEPRTCVGVSRDSTKVYILAVDGRNVSYSNGMTFEELSKCLMALGSYNAVNLDGGGSTTFFVRNTPDFTANRFEIRNSPTDTTREREVANGLLFISKK